MKEFLWTERSLYRKRHWGRHPAGDGIVYWGTTYRTDSLCL